jgi:hypothetical protein
VENNDDWIDETLNEITGNASDPSMSEGWLYPYACSPTYVASVMHTLLFLCQNPVKGLVLKVIDELKGKEFSPSLTPKLLDYYFSEFLKAIPLPLSEGEETSKPKSDNSNRENCHTLREDLENYGPERLLLEQAIEMDISDEYCRLLAPQMLDAWLGLGVSVPDDLLHSVYLEMVLRLKETRILSEDSLDGILKAERYKLDEIFALEYVRRFLCSHEAALKKFFAITGEKLPKMLTRAMKAIGGVTDADEESEV